MMDFLRSFQLDLMLVMIGVCGILALMAMLTKTLSPKRRHALVALEMSVMLLLFFDRLAYLYRGDVSSLGLVMTRLSNFMVFFFTLFMIHAVNLYLVDLIRRDGEMRTAPKPLIAVEALFLAGVILLIIAQFTGLYYTFDDQNRYQRAPGFIICYLFPMVMTALQHDPSVCRFHRADLCVRDFVDQSHHRRPGGDALHLCAAGSDGYGDQRQ